MKYTGTMSFSTHTFGDEDAAFVAVAAPPAMPDSTTPLRPSTAHTHTLSSRGGPPPRPGHENGTRFYRMRHARSAHMLLLTGMETPVASVYGLSLRTLAVIGKLKPPHRVRPCPRRHARPPLRWRQSTAAGCRRPQRRPPGRLPPLRPRSQDQPLPLPLCHQRPRFQTPATPPAPRPRRQPHPLNPAAAPSRRACPGGTRVRG